MKSEAHLLKASTLKPTAELAQIQSYFLESVNRAPMESKGKGSDALAQQINSAGKLDALARIDIYRNNTQQTRIRTLNDIYPITREVLGEKFFNQQCGLFSQQHPPQHWNLNLYGEELPSFINNKLTLSLQKQLPYLNDLGRMEWLLHKSYYSTGSGSFPVEAFGKLSPFKQENCRLQLAPDIALLSTNWPIYQFWRSLQTGSLPDSVEAVYELEYLCIYQDELRPTVQIINPNLYQLLEQLANHSLAELAKKAELSEALPQLPQCIEKGWITGFYFPDDHHLQVSTDV